MSDSDKDKEQTPQPPKPQPPRPGQSSDLSDAPSKHTARIQLPKEGEEPKTARVSISGKPTSKTSQVKTSQVPLRKETVRITLKAPSAESEAGKPGVAKPMAPAPPSGAASGTSQSVSPKPVSSGDDAPKADESPKEGDKGDKAPDVTSDKPSAPSAPPAPDKPSAPKAPTPPVTPTANLQKPPEPGKAPTAPMRTSGPGQAPTANLQKPPAPGKTPSVPLRPSTPGQTTPTKSLKTGPPAGGKPGSKTPTISLKMGAGPSAPGKMPTVPLKSGGASSTQSLPRATTKLKQTGPLSSQPRPSGVGTAPIKKATTAELEVGDEESDLVPIILSAAVLIGTLFIFAAQFAKTKLPEIDEPAALQQATIWSLILD